MPKIGNSLLLNSGVSNDDTLTRLLVWDNTTGTVKYRNYSSVTSGLVSGTGTSGQITYWNGTGSVTGSATLTYTPTTSLLVNNSVTAASQFARGVYLTPSLTAAASYDVLAALEIAPTFTNGAFTAVDNLGLRIVNSNMVFNESTAPSNANRYLVFNSAAAASTSVSNIFSIGTRLGPSNANRGAQIKFAQIGTTNSFGELASDIQFWTWIVGTDNGAERMRLTSTGLLLLGSTTSTGEKLQVTGTSKFTGAATFSSSVTASSLVKSGGTSSQFLKADGTVDSNTYLTANQNISLTGAVTGSGTTAITTTLSNSIVGIANLSATGTPSATTYLRGDNTWATITASSGTVTSVSVVSANGFAGTVATATTTPAITISTSITGLLKGNGTAISAAVAGTDYQAPITLTTTGASGAATFSSNTLNIPTYTLTGLGGFANPMTTLGDMIYGAASGVATRLAAGTSGQALVSAGAAAPAWTTLTLENIPDAWVKRSVKVATTAAITLSGTQTIDGIAVVAGDRVLVKDQGTSSANGIYVVAAGAWTRAADADSASELSAAIVGVDQGTTNGGLSFDTDFKSTDTLGTTAMTWNRMIDTGYTIPATQGGTGQTSYAVGDLLYASTTTALSKLAAVATGSYLKSAGTNTAPTWGTIAGADVTGAALTKTDDTNVTLTLGGTPTTALLRAASLTLGWTGQLSVARGGTGAATLTGVVIGTGTTAMTSIASTTALQVFRVNSAGTGYEFATLTSLTNPMTTLGDMIYGAAAGAATRVAGNTTTAKQYLSQTGNGTASAAPVWASIAGADVTGAALTKTDDTNVTLTLGGTPTTALLRAASLTLGWTGTLAVSRGGTGAGTLTGVAIGNGTSAMTAVSSTTALQVFRVNSAGTGYEFATISSGSVTSVSVVSANGFAGTVATNTTTPAITLTTTITGLLKGNGTAISAATAGTDYSTSSSTETLTNKRITKRTSTTTSTATLTMDISSADEYSITAQAVGLTLANPIGTPVEGDKLLVRIKDNGTARSIGFNTGTAGSFRASTDLAFPTTTIINKTLYMGFRWNATDSRWDMIALINNF